MKISELKGILVNIIEVPEDPVKWVGELLLRKDEFFEQRSPKLLDMLVRAFALECVWDEFNEVLEREGKDLNIEVTTEELEILLGLTEQFFTKVEISRDGLISSEEIRKDKNVLLEAISVVKSSL